MKFLAKFSLAFGGVALISGIAVGAWLYLEPNPMDEMEKIVKQSFKDPDSAKFSKVTYSSKTGYYCGLVNARNSMGGYVGNKRFVASLSGDVFFDPERLAPDPLPEESLHLIVPSTSVYGRELDTVNMANQTLERSRQIEAHIQASRSARAENNAFEQLVRAKCFN